MRLGSSIVIHRPLEAVWAYMGDVSNIPKWDRGVADVAYEPTGMTGVGSEFETVADVNAPGDVSRNGRMSYRIEAIASERNECTVELTSRDGNARFFKRASWTFRAVGTPSGTLLTCSVHFVLRVQWLVLAPILYLLRGAITRDLERSALA
jgi:hypothetical protein